MIDDSEKRNRQLAFELSHVNSHVWEKRSNFRRKVLQNYSALTKNLRNVGESKNNDQQEETTCQ